jgi:hypothetical protein
MKEYCYNDLEDKFRELFKREPEDRKLMVLVEMYGVQKIGMTLSWLILSGLKPVKPPTVEHPYRDNPYGLILALLKSDKGI